MKAHTNERLGCARGGSTEARVSPDTSMRALNPMEQISPSRYLYASTFEDPKGHINNFTGFGIPGPKFRKLEGVKKFMCLPFYAEKPKKTRGT